MVNIVIPMAGQGTRFSQYGYTVPKPLIMVNNRPFFYYSAMSLVRFFDYAKIVFVGLEEHNPDGKLEQEIKKYFPDAVIKLLDKTPPGAVLTSREAIPFIDNDYPVIFNDCDHMFYSEDLRLNQDKFTQCDGFLMTFYADSPKFSYVIKDDKGMVTGTKEKIVVSNEAIGGVYGFKNIELFDKASSEYLKECAYDEFFMSGVYNIPLLQNIQTYTADFNISFGTVEEFESVKNSNIFNFFH